MDNNDVRQKLLGTVDEMNFVTHHFKTMITAGMGFFTDAYDLFIIGVVIALLIPIWHLTTLQISILGSTSLIAATIGALIFGKISDIFGRKFIYGIEVTILAIAAIFSAFSQNFVQLIIWRFILGLGIGGDYPVSAIIMSEYANRKDRGKLVSMVFSMQGLGLIVGPVLALLILSLGTPHDIAWRILLAFGAVPSASVIYLRRTIKETPHYSLSVKGDISGTNDAIRDLNGTKLTMQANEFKEVKNDHLKVHAKWQDLFKYPNILKLIGTAGGWFLMDWAFYGNSISWPLVMKSFMPHATLIQGLAASTIIFILFASPFYWIAAFKMDSLGRKFIQILGFVGMAAMYLIISLTNYAGYMLPSVLFILVFGISYIFVEFGPNTTTFVYPAEVFPTSIRGLGDGISASAGKLGAFLGTFLFPFFIKYLHISGTFMILVVVCIAGALLTLVALPETKGISLSEASNEGKYIHGPK